MLDEIQDSNATTLEIFKLITAEKKIGVGDMHQSIMGFNNCINGFMYLQDEVDETIKLTKSFRVSNEIAKKVEIFGKKFLSPNFSFVGIDYDDDTIESEMYISRTNGSLISQMIRLNNSNTPYNLSSKDRVQKIFGLLLTIIGLKPGCKVYSQEHKFLLNDMKAYYASETIRGRHKTLFSYIATQHSKDRQIKSACKAITDFGGKTIWDAYNVAKAHESAKTTHKLTLTTCHSAKGGEADKVVLDPDMFPDFLQDKGKMTESEIQQELNLVYVAVTRAKKQLLGASWLETI